MDLERNIKLLGTPERAQVGWRCWGRIRMRGWRQVHAGAGMLARVQLR